MNTSSDIGETATVAVIETERLMLRPLAVTDAPFILELLNSPGWLESIGDRGIRTADAAKQYIKNGPVKSYAENGFGLMCVEQKALGKPIGMCGLIKRAGLDHPDIGFALLPSFEGQGYATEAAAMVMAGAMENASIRCVLAITSKNNKASIHVLSKLGMEPAGFITLPGDKEELNLFTTPSTWKKS
jgi:RimJ/RimL family protein N-acetyltransferase